MEKNDIVRERHKTMEKDRQLEEIEKQRDDYKRKIDEYTYELARLVEKH